MPRKPAILISILLLLLIGGGAVAFHFHLRAQATPSFSEVDEFLKRPPESLGWLAISEHPASAMDPVTSMPAHEWLERLGIPFRKEVRERNYSYTAARKPGSRSLHVTVYYNDQGIQRVRFSGQTTADSTSFSGALGEKFPRLRRVSRTMSPCPL